MSEIMNSKSMTRRGFVAAAGAAAVAGFVSSKAMAAETSGGEDSSSTATSTSGAASDAPTAVENYICPGDWLGEAPTFSESEIDEESDTDVLILGGGNAGACAALSAAQEGVAVTVVEEQSDEDFSVYGDDICALNSQWMIDHGFGPYNVGEVTAEVVKRCGGRVNAEVVREGLEYSGKAFDNLISVIPDTSNALDRDTDQYTIQIAYDKPDGSYYPIEVGGYKTWASTFQTWGTSNPTPVHNRTGINRITEFCYYMLDAAADLGAQVLFGHKAIVLTQNDDGDVTGAIVETPEGKHMRINASKGVLLACGDFGKNPDMVYNLVDDVSEWATRAGQTRDTMLGFAREGDGHKMGCWAGGVIDAHPRACLNSAGGASGPWGTTPTLYLNARGHRFMNEAQTPAIAGVVMRQPHGPITTILDADYMECLQSAGIDHGAPDFGAPGVIKNMQDAMAQVPVDDPAGALVPDVSIIDSSDTYQVYAASTLEDLLTYVGYEGDDLQNALDAIERYNEICHSGEDEDFAKDPACLHAIEKPPFYASATDNTGETAVLLVTLAGLITDEKLNVLKADHTTPIKGLYAAGNCLGQRFGIAYTTPLPGTSMGMAYGHGYYAGKVIAAL